MELFKEQKVIYTLKNYQYEIRIVNEDIYPEKIWNCIPEATWNAFLDEHGSNPKCNGKRICGIDSVPPDELHKLNKDL